MRKEFKLEVGTIAMPEGTSSDEAVQISKAISLKRIADALDRIVAQPVNVKQPSIFEEIFGYVPNSKSV